MTVDPLVRTPQQVADALGWHVQTVYRFIRSGEIRVVPVGHRKKIPLVELDRLLGRPSTVRTPPQVIDEGVFT